MYSSPLKPKTVERVWKMMGPRARGEHPTLSGISVFRFNMKDVGFVTKREYFLAIQKGHMDRIFGCNLGSNSMEREERIRIVGERFWNFALHRGGYVGHNDEGYITMADGSTQRPICHLRHVFPQCNDPNGQVLKLGFHLACVHPRMQVMKADWLAQFGPARGLPEESSDEESTDEESSDEESTDEDSTDEDSSEEEEQKPKQPARAVQSSIVKKKLPTVADSKRSVFEAVVEGLRAFREDIRRRHLSDATLFSEGTVIGPVVEGYVLFVKKRSTAGFHVDFYMKPPGGRVLRSVPELQKSLA